jgi:hypothetical protein
MDVQKIWDKTEILRADIRKHKDDQEAVDFSRRIQDAYWAAYKKCGNNIAAGAA